jgi:hypothetical protein
MVWKKSDDPPTHQPEPTPAPRPMTASASTPAPAPVQNEPSRPISGRATIGPSIFIKGDLSGEEDLVIEGRVEGKVDLKQNNVTIGKNGRVKADVLGKVVVIEGEVDGLEDGSRFKGSIDMESPKEMGGSASGRHVEPSHEANRPEPAGVKATA